MAVTAREDVPNEATWRVLESIATDALEVTERYQTEELNEVVVGSPEYEETLAKLRRDLAERDVNFRNGVAFILEHRFKHDVRRC